MLILLINTCTTLSATETSTNFGEGVMASQRLRRKKLEGGRAVREPAE